MSNCFSCGMEHDRWRDAAHTLPASSCHACHAAWMRTNRKRHSELPPAVKAKANARSYANNYLKRGKIVRQPCAECGTEPAQMHHPDYTLPLTVIWLCAPCHQELHRNDAELHATRTTHA